jgi:hypothetical protein
MNLFRHGEHGENPKKDFCLSLRLCVECGSQVDSPTFVNDFLRDLRVSVFSVSKEAFLKAAP